ncbi:IDI-3 protein [Venturia nashicola]|uniref:IDI-3 protein n=1 Tax=Venturia nashicola TaxID=86259 RepID=A0A4Z1NS03_9PEZI|nr:IDI-3 protein [Venturia nashicola]TLD29552.1 IDI-3 protein [Venturia nashicola]
MQLLTLLFIASLTSALPTPDVPTGPNIITLKDQSIYEVSTGRINLQSPTGHIFKTTSSGKDLTTLLTFTLPSTLQGKTCSFHFFRDAAARTDGSNRFDLFSSLSPATPSSTNNQRDQFMGRMDTAVPGEATWVADVWPKSGQSFPCPSGGDFGYELVGVGDNVDVSWNRPQSGGYISWV